MNQYMPNYLKTKNRLLIYDLIRTYQTTSRAELVRLTGMSFPTVLKVVDKMIELGIIVESDEMESPSGAGRRGHLLCFHARAYYAIGIEFEGHIATVGLVDLLGDCTHTSSFALVSSSQQLNMELLNHKIHGLIDIAEEEQIPILGIGIGFPAMINAEKNTILRSSFLDVQTEVSFRDVFPEFFAGIDLPVFLDNEVNYACTGEYFLRRSDSSARSLLYLTLGTGCGAGLMMDGKLWYGTNHKSGEIGHMVCDPSELVHWQKGQAPGILEDLVNLDAITRRFGIDLRKSTDISQEGRDKIIDYLTPYLCYVINHFVFLLDINCCTLTGLIPLALGPALLEKVQAMLDGTMFSNHVSVKPAAHKNTGIIGAGVSVFEHCMEEMFREA